MEGYCVEAKAQTFEAGQCQQNRTVDLDRQCCWGFECLQTLVDQEHTEFKESF